MIDNIKKLESSLWEAADQLRANSKLTASEYSMPVLGLIFLRHSYNRFLIAEKSIVEKLPSRGGRTRAVTKEDFDAVNAMFLPENSRYDKILNLPEDQDIGTAINNAMKAIEDVYDNLKNVLPKTYNKFENELLVNLLKIFNREELRNATGDLFGKIYEYFLNEFAKSGAQEGGEFFTPVSLVQMIVNIIEPTHGIVFDPACGSGGMFVQTGHFIENEGKKVNEAVTFRGQEKAELNSNLALMNMAVHGLNGKIIQGNTFYEDKHELVGKCDFVMANPPFNVDGVSSEKVKNDERLPFGLGGVNDKKKQVSNANYLWIQYFYSYLNEKGRAGFVMASSATDAGNKDKDVRQKLIESGVVDVIVSIGNNFFYTRSLPCTLWFFDKNKRAELKDKVLMLDARNIYRKVTRNINDFTPEQLKNLNSIVWLYRGENEKYFKLIDSYIDDYINKTIEINDYTLEYYENIEKLIKKIDLFVKDNKNDKLSIDFIEIDNLFSKSKEMNLEIKEMIKKYEEYKNINKYDFNDIEKVNEIQKELYNEFYKKIELIKRFEKGIDHIYKTISGVIDYAEKELDAKKNEKYDNKEISKLIKDIDEQRKENIKKLKEIIYFYKQVEWLQSKFVNGKFEDIEGLCKLTDKKDISKNDWSLTPGRYVGVAPKVEDEDFNFEVRMKEIHIELDGLNQEAFTLAGIIKANFEELGI